MDEATSALPITSVFLKPYNMLKRFCLFFCWEYDVLNEGDYSFFHLQAQWEGLTGVCQSLRNRRIESRVVSGEIVEQLDLLFKLFPFDVLYSHQETGNLVTFQRDQNVQKWCRERGVKWVEMNPSSVMRGGDADRRRLKLRQADYRRQEPLPIPDFSHLEPLVPGIAGQPPSWKEVTSVVPKFKGQPLNPSLTKVNEKSAHDSFTPFCTSGNRIFRGHLFTEYSLCSRLRLSSHLAWGTMKT